MLYAMRVFVSGDDWSFYDMPWNAVPQRIVHQRDLRWPVQG